MYSFKYHGRQSKNPFTNTVSARHLPAAPQPLDGPPTLSQVADPERLIETFHFLKKYAGQAVGTDGVRFSDIRQPRRASPDAGFERTIVRGPVPANTPPRGEKPKASGGTRTLSISDILERVVSRSLTDVMSPFWEQVFHAWSPVSARAGAPGTYWRRSNAKSRTDRTWLSTSTFVRPLTACGLAT